MPPTYLKHTAKAVSILGLFLAFTFAYQSCQTLEADNPLLITVGHMEFVSEGSYKITGTLASLGNKEILEYGICWSEVENPDLQCAIAKIGPPAAAGKFSATISGLSPSTTYYFRAFAVMPATTDYSEQKQFTTRPAAEDMVMDVDGNIYRLVTIGDQTWMADNLKASRYPDKSPIPLVEDKMEWFHFTRESEGYSWYENVLTHGYAYGGLYSWAAATAAHDGISLIEEGVQGVCPNGWHLPSDDEWKHLEMYLGMSQDEADASKWRGEDQGGKLKQEGIAYWKSPNTSATDEFGFSALPGGYRHGSGDFKDVAATARFWTSTVRGYGFAWYRGIDFDRAAVYRDFSGVYRGHSVRCVKDD